MIRAATPRVSPFVLLFSLSLCHMGSFASAGSPRLTRITPPGGQQGTTVEVHFVGLHLEDPREVVFYESGITTESIEPIEGSIEIDGRKLAVEAGTRVRVRLKLAGDCPLGPHGMRLRTLGGVTEYQRFFVGPFPIVEEGEQQQQRNDKRDSAKSVPVNTTVLGRLMESTDVDTYRIEVKRGQRVSAEVEAARLGVERGIPDMHLAIYDASGKTLAAADDSALFVQDPTLSVLADHDGTYFVEVRHCMYNGNGDVYRLHLGTFTRPTAIYPAGGSIGTELNIRILGDPKGVRTQTVRVPTTPGDFDFVAIDPADGVPAASPNRFRASPFSNVLETEPNDSPETLSATSTHLPIAFNGIIDKPGDVDCFRFRAARGEKFTFHAMANVLGSTVDPVIWVKPVDSRTKSAPQRVTDSRANQHGLAPSGGLIRDTQDPILEFTAPADGDYILGVENERGEGSADAVYRVEARPESTAVYTYIAPEPQNQFLPQLRQSVAVAAGNQYTAQVGIFSTGRPVGGELEIVGVNLPRGVTLRAPKLTPGVTRVPVVFEAAPDVQPQAALVELKVQPVHGPAVESGYRQTITMNQYGNNDYYLHTSVDKLALVVTEPAPFRIEVEEPKSALVQNGEMTLKFKVIRSAGFEDPVTVQMEWRPAGINTATPTTVNAGANEGTYLLGATRGASPGTHQVTLTAMTGGSRRGYRDGESRTYVAAKPFQLTVAEPHVEARIARTSVERGKTATLVCKLNHLQPIPGKAVATLARLPRGIELVEPTRDITATDKEVSFQIRATSEALVGNYQGIVLDLTVNDNGQSIRQLSGSGVLRVDAERGVPSKRK